MELFLKTTKTHLNILFDILIIIKYNLKTKMI